MIEKEAPIAAHAYITPSGVVMARDRRRLDVRTRRGYALKSHPYAVRGQYYVTSNRTILIQSVENRDWAVLG